MKNLLTIKELWQHCSPIDKVLFPLTIYTYLISYVLNDTVEDNYGKMTSARTLKKQIQLKEKK